MINIQDLAPLLREGWVAMDKDGNWWWYELKPTLQEKSGFWNGIVTENILIEEDYLKDIAPADDWTKSLIKVG